MRRRRPVDEDSSVPRVACHVLHAKTLRVARQAWCCIARCWPEGERRDSTSRPHLPNPHLLRTLTLKALICAIDRFGAHRMLRRKGQLRRPRAGRGGHEQSQGVPNCSNKELRIAAIAGAPREGKAAA